ncbi:MAG: acyl-CoA thioesterase II [Microbacteriaceae bacterium]
MGEPVEALLAVLGLSDTGARTSEDIFTGPSQGMPQGRVFGGQVLAQSMLAAARTVDEPGRSIHSLHGYFLRPGDDRRPITFGVDRIHDGRSFSTRRTQAYQGGVPILSMIASFQDENPGLEHQAPMPEGLPEPETLPTTAQAIGRLDHPVARSWATERPFDVRHVDTPIYLSADGERHPQQAVWFRAADRLPDDPDLHRAALAYASDYVILEPILRAHGVPWVTEGLRVASLDHAMWWHRFARADEWMLYTQDSPNARGGRGLAFGRIFSRAGALVASVAQEGMVRLPGV